MNLRVEQQSSDLSADQQSWRLCLAEHPDVEALWYNIQKISKKIYKKELCLRPLLKEVILDAPCLGTSLSFRLARKLAREDMPREELKPILAEVLTNNKNLVKSAAADLQAICERDPACSSPVEPLLFYKGFHAITTYRLAHYFWNQGRKWLAYYLESIGNEIFSVDIHPGARIGCGIFLDHASSIIIGETAIIEDDVSLLHEVTLGGTGKETGDRHPIVRSGVLIGAGSKILGRVTIGEGAKIGAGSVVLEDVPPHTTVAGVPAIVVGKSAEENPAHEMDQKINTLIKDKPEENK